MRCVVLVVIAICVFIWLSGCALLPKSNVAEQGRNLLEDYCSLPQFERLAYRDLINESKHKIIIECSHDQAEK